MKRAELEIGKAYYLNTSTDWTGNIWISSSLKTPAQVALYIKASNLVRIKETQLLTDYNKRYHSREVLVTRANGREEWVSLNHIRGGFTECVKLICQRKIKSEGAERASRYAKHLQRKETKEVIEPARKELVKLINGLGEGYGHVSYYDRIDQIPHHIMVKLIEALKKVEA